MPMATWSLTDLTLSPTSNPPESIEEFRLFRLQTRALSCEYKWGLEPGELDLSCSINHISVRRDIAELFSARSVTIIPQPETLKAMMELTHHNQSAPISQRRRCYDVFPIQSYKYTLVIGRRFKARGPPIYLFNANKSTFEKFEHPYIDLPQFTLNVYPFHSIMHSGQIVPPSGPNKDLMWAVLRLSINWSCCLPPEFGPQYDSESESDIVLSSTALHHTTDTSQGSWDASETENAAEQVDLSLTTTKVSKWLGTIDNERAVDPSKVTSVEFPRSEDLGSEWDAHPVSDSYMLDEDRS
ncbi:hypothetical protein BDP27DRAFT_1448884 [Rhodocollybia butyracea]|uniref:Uncharacterized protein n=1 Tax=Rhodocollybia butyracea TaxID=206335 RepID=A0A9P5PKZ3_9AGAR|nr:hypothetical protein BDP27DRAFT_1448884 [Rhodocollybia butyracea]